VSPHCPNQRSGTSSEEGHPFKINLARVPSLVLLIKGIHHRSGQQILLPMVFDFTSSPINNQKFRLPLVLPNPSIYLRDTEILKDMTII
jgi:hypothetical protein